MLDADHCDHRNPPFHLPNNVVPQCAKSHSNTSSGIFSSCLTCTFMLGFPATPTDLALGRLPRRTGLKTGRVAIGPRGVSWLHITQRGWSWGRGQRDGRVVCPSSLPSFSIVGVSQSEVRLERLFYLSERRKWHKLIRSGLFRRPRLDTGIFCTEDVVSFPDASSTALKDGESFKFISSRILPWLWEAPCVYQCLVGQSPETVGWLSVRQRGDSSQSVCLHQRLGHLK